jgi:polyisoprenyl-phosphate glycosyltransferase
MPKLSIIIPVYFSEKNLGPLYEDLKEKVLEKLEDYEIVMVDDGSGDGSYAEMQRLSHMDKHIHIIKLSRNFGSHAAILCGFLNCKGDCAVIKSADLQEPSELLLDMFESWKRGNKVVLAARSSREEKVSQKMFANTYYGLVRKFALPNMPKHGFDCFLIDRKVIKVLELLDERNSAITLQVLWAGFQTDVVYYARKKREIGKSRWTFAKKFKLVIDSLVSFSFFPIRFMSVIGLLFFIGSVIWGLVIFILRIFGNIPIEGYTTIMLLLLFASGLILLTLGILGEYIWRTLDAARKRPVYIVDRIQDDEEKERKV